MASAFLVAMSAVGTVALAELGLRLAGFSYPAFHAMDDITGYRLRPNAEGWYGKEGGAYVKVNSHGLRDRERSLEKPPETARIAVLGDSFAEALQVPLEAAFPARLEKLLRACRAYGERDVEVLNFGVSNYGTGQELLTLRHRVWAYSPDMVLLAFLPANDVRNNSHVLEPGKNRPFFVQAGDELILDASFASEPEWQEGKELGEQRVLLHPLRIYQLLRKAREGTYRGWNDAPAAARLASAGLSAPLSEFGIDEEVYRVPATRAWREAWTLTERLIQAMHRETLAGGAEFLVAVLSSAASVYPDAALRQRYAAALGVPDLFYPERRLAALGRRSGFPVLALGPAMQRAADETGKHFHGFPNTQLGFGHWNASGHDAAARLIAARLCAGSPDQPTAGFEPL